MALLLLLLPLLPSCQARKLSLEECENLSFKAYKGFPKALNDFEKHCGEHEVTYTRELCQKALGDLVLKGDGPSLKEKYGERILNCFSEKEKTKFLKK